MIKNLLIVLLFPFPIFSDDPEEEKLFEVEWQHEDIRTDELGNLYLLNRVEIRKWDRNGKHQFDYSNNSLGRITDVDFSRSLKPLVFYSDLSTLVVLDNTLSVQGSPVDLGSYDLDQAELVCNSVNSNYWFFDASRNELIRTDRSFRRVDRSGNLARLLRIRLNPTHMVEFREHLYLSDPKEGILVFDIFASHLRTIPIKNVERFQVSSEKIHFFRDGEFFVYDRTTHEEKRIGLPEEGAKKVHAGRRRLYISNGEKVSVYRTKRKEIPQEKKKLDPNRDR